ncbi:MAG: hypothetical protein MOB07_11585 [Acidobacteria bacterium]|nr:hypothetical protein [Acidobacteriota bacterium]
MWQRPKRVAAAKLELELVGETLVSRSLDLVRDTRLAYADYAVAQRRASLTTEAVRERGESPQSSTPDFAPAISANWRRAPRDSTLAWPRQRRRASRTTS